MKTPANLAEMAHEETGQWLDSDLLETWVVRRFNRLEQKIRNLESEHEAKVIQNVQLMRERDAYRNAEETQIALRQKLEEDQERNERLAQVESMRHVANWLSGAIEEGCIGLDLAGEISGPTGCSDADRCRVAGERIFREAARIWECKFVLEAKQ